MLQKVPCAVNPLNTAELTPQILLPSENRVRIQLQQLWRFLNPPIRGVQKGLQYYTHLRVAAGGKEVRRWGQKAGLICLRAGRSCPPAPLQIRPAYRVGAGR